MELNMASLNPVAIPSIFWKHYAFFLITASDIIPMAMDDWCCQSFTMGKWIKRFLRLGYHTKKTEKDITATFWLMRA